MASGEMMALYAANNIAKGIEKFAATGGVRVGGILCNSRNVDREEALVQEFSSRLGTQLLQFIPRDNMVQHAENHCQTVLTYAPESAQAAVYRELAEHLEKNQNLAIPTPLSREALEALFTGSEEDDTPSVS